MARWPQRHAVALARPPSSWASSEASSCPLFPTDTPLPSPAARQRLFVTSVSRARLNASPDSRRSTRPDRSLLERRSHGRLSNRQRLRRAHGRPHLGHFRHPGWVFPGHMVPRLRG